MPDAQEKEDEGLNIVNKLQAMNKSEEQEDSVPEVQAEPNPAPKFLVIDTTEEELEELAKIDAELARTNEEEIIPSSEEPDLVN